MLMRYDVELDCGLELDECNFFIPSESLNLFKTLEINCDSMWGNMKEELPNVAML